MLPKIKFNRTWVVLGVALLIGGVSAFIASRYLSNRIEAIESKEKNMAKVRVVVPIEDLPKGTKINQSNVAVREVPKEWAHSMSITEAQFDRAENGTLNAPAVRGEPIIWAQLDGLKAPAFSSHLTAGRRALTVPVDEVSSVSGMLEPGDRIDVVCTVKKDGRVVIFNVLQNVTVLAAGTRVSQKSDTEGKDTSFTTVTLNTSPEDATRVIAAREVGKVTAMLRAPDDAQVVSSAKNDAMSVLGLNAPVVIDVEKGPAVPVIYGGSGNKLTDIPGFHSSLPKKSSGPNSMGALSETMKSMSQIAGGLNQ
jgi:pilus assembly protein CpaB